MKLEDIKELCDKYSVELSFEMPEGYEDAFGTYDVTVNTLFLNLSLTTDKEYIRDYYFIMNCAMHISILTALNSRVRSRAVLTM